MHPIAMEHQSSAFEIQPWLNYDGSFFVSENMIRIRCLSMMIKIAMVSLVLSCNKQPAAIAGGTIALPPLPTDTSLRHYLALGDSYTIGESVPIVDRYPVITTGILKAGGMSIAEPEIIARTGWTTGELQAAINSTSFKFSYDIVTLLIGVNNQYRGSSIDLYRQEFGQNLKNAIQLARGKADHVIVLSIPDYSVTPFGQHADPEKTATELAAFNQVNKEISETLGVNYLDVTSDSKKALNDPSMVAGDGLHYSGKMYRLWAEKLAAIIKTKLL